MEIPKIVIDGTEYSAKKITVGDWREILKLNEKYESENSIKNAANIAIQGILLIYDVSDKEIEKMSFEDVANAYIDASKYVYRTFYEKINKLPNVETAAAEQ